MPVLPMGLNSVLARVRFASQALSACGWSSRCSSSFYHGKSPQLISCNLNRRELHASKSLFGVVPFKLSDIGEGIKEVVIKEWYVKVGDSVHQFDPICEVQSDKATVTITSRYDGSIKSLHFKTDDTCCVGQPLVDIEVSGEGGAEETGEGSVASAATEAPATAPSAAPAESPRDESAKEASAATQPAGEHGKVLAAPSVRRIAMENKVNLADVRGTGRDGRILKEDILNYLNSKVPVMEAEAARGVAAAEPRQKVLVVGEDKTVPLNWIQKVMCKTMTKSNEIPRFIASDELDVTKLVELRARIKESVQKQYGVKLTYMPFLLKAISLCLQKYPILNALTDEKCENITYKAAHNIGIAMDTPQGLLVPNIKSVDQLSIIEIAEELARLQKLGADGKLGPQDLKGGTMTLSSIGNIGCTYASPLISPPEVLIGAIGKIQRVPRFDEHDNVRAAHILNVSWAADHRVIDGATVARFTTLWKQYLEEPSTLVLQMK
ncbi:unnamed protein product [Calicophoron daubneyi]|uniref:Dihydrolipoamide acetyltransferase component of pyruvate dehydrogenase complex n=1 Tax=Calicophoron daubneyi TaxID=300641 RepID=A0AAV2TJF5_CALDB